MMATRFKRLLTFLAFVGAMGAALAQNERHIDCPARIPLGMIQFANAPAGWTPNSTANFPLSTAFVMSGPPESRQELVPEVQQESKTKSVARWDLHEFAANEKWISCGYGAGSEVTLSRRLDAATTSCTVTLDKRPARGNAVDIRCILPKRSSAK